MPKYSDQILAEYEEKSKQKQSIATALENKRQEIKKIQSGDPLSDLTKCNETLNEVEQTLEELEINKPILQVQSYSEEDHRRIKIEYDSTLAQRNNIKNELSAQRQHIIDVDKGIEKTRFYFEKYPVLESELKDLNEKVNLHKFVVEIYKETSKELRGKVIPHAALLINQILPTLTDGRYSDFEIAEDMAFKVHSIEAGGYKERELFSGGTQDQFLIALRLAFTQSILDSRVMADRYALLMDECISSSDEERRQGIFEVLNAMKKIFSQTFIIAHEDVSSFVDYNITLGRNSHGYTEITAKSW